MERKPHVIKVTTGDRIPYRWVLAVLEYRRSIPVRHSGASVLELKAARLAMLRVNGPEIVRETYRDITDLSELWDCVRSQTPRGTRCELIIPGAFTAASVIGLWDEVVSGRYELRGPSDRRTASSERSGRRRVNGLCVLERQPFIAELRDRQTGAVVTLSDPANYCWPGDLPDQTLETRIKRLVDWLGEYLLTIHYLKLGTWQRTLAGQAYYGWRRSYVEAAVSVHCDTLAIGLERLAYYGGRCEVRFRGRVNTGASTFSAVDYYGDNCRTAAAYKSVDRYDINCAYGHAAAVNKLPTQLLRVTTTARPEEVYEQSYTNGVIAAVTVDLTDPVCPYSPLRDCQLEQLLSGKDWQVIPQGISETVIYPIGQFRTVLCGPEIQLAMLHGRILTVHAAAYYQLDWVLREWAEALWRERYAARLAGRELVAGALKLLPVVLIGRLGRQRRTWVDVPTALTDAPYSSWYDLDPQTKQLRRWRAVAWRTQREDVGGETWDSVPSIPAYITSLARRRLWELIETVGLSSVYYYDTDSIWVNGATADIFRQGELLDYAVMGKLKVEGSYQWAEFHGPKHYITPDGAVCASRPRDSQTDGSGTYWWADLEGFPHCLPKRHSPEPIERVRTWRVPRSLPTGVLGTDGWVSPLRLTLSAD